jgi:multidrug efflux system membrane fusion protein
MKTLIARLIRARRAQVLAAAVLTLSAMLAFAAHQERGAPEAPLPLVVALPVHSFADTQSGDPRYPVEVAARYANAMSFRVAGKLIERSARLGDSVRKGQVIARLDPIDAQKQAAAARAALDAAEHRLVFARQQLDRDTAQSAQNLIAASQLEQTQDAYSAALSGREQAADELLVARHTLDYHTLIADHDGLITSEDADTGQVLAAGQPVFGLAWSGAIDVILDAAANDISVIAPGRSASVAFPALPGHRFDAQVREVAPSADPQSRTYRIKLTLNDPGHLARLGMTGDASIAPPAVDASNADAHTFKVPATALFHRGKEPAVWVIRAADSSLELRAVAVRSYGERSVVIARGLSDGDVVVQAGVHTVYEGERVQAVRPLFDGEGDQELNASADPYVPVTARARS